MNALSTIHYRKKLLRRRDEILRTVHHLRKENSDLAAQKHFEWLDQSWDEKETKLIDRLSDVYRAEIEKIDKALERIETGTYGACLACHQRIPRARLNAFPAAEFCHDCQDMREHFQRAS